MLDRVVIVRLLAIATLAALVGSARAQATAFTYQGELRDASGAAFDGTIDLRARLYAGAASGTGIGSQLCVNDIVVVGGRFTVALDFGSVYAGVAPFLELEVRPDPSSSVSCAVVTGFTLLSPRQPITPAPQATYAAQAATATQASQLGGQSAAFYLNASNFNAGVLGSARLSGIYANSLIFNNAANSFAGNGAALTALNATAVSTGTLADARLSINIPRLASANTFTTSNTFSSIGIGITPTLPLQVSSTLQTPMQVQGSNTGGTWVNLGNSAAGGKMFNFIATGPSNSEGAGKLLVRDNTSGVVRMALDGSGRVGIGTVTPAANFDVTGPDAASYLRNSNDQGGAFLLDSFGALQLGMYNPSATAWGQIAAGERRSMLGMDSTGKVGSLTNTGNAPTFRNLLDNGSGEASIAGSITIAGNAQVNSQVAIGGSVGGESLRVYGGMLQDQDTNGPGFMTIQSSRVTGPQFQLINLGAGGKQFTMRNSGTGASSALVFENFTDSREMLRIARTGAATFGGGVTAAGPVAGTSFSASDSNSSVSMTLSPPFINVSAPDFGATANLRVFNVGYGGGTSNAASFTPDVQVNRALLAATIAAGVKLFRIDHPLDPDNKYPQHACIESDQMTNLYRGNVTLDEAGRAVVTLPAWFEALNTDLAYQLTSIGGWAPVFIEQECKDGFFVIAGGKPGMRVSWLITATRHDEFAQHTPLEVEKEKEAADKGHKLFWYPATGTELAPRVGQDVPAKASGSNRRD
ncbi:MAG: hypothetical protein NTV94_00215 [Planctomycetota bacterium]|nr:hypothetical protein [Planctomycetota bacterium]